jgi:hypothetical protein
LRKEGFAAALAIAVRFLPFHDARATVQQSRFGLLGDRILLARGTAAELLGKVLVHGFGLPSQQQIAQLFLKIQTHLKHDTLDLSEGRPKTRSRRPIEPIRKIFYLSLEKKSARFDFGRCCCLENHPWPPERVMKSFLPLFPPTLYHIQLSQGKSSRAPTLGNVSK